MACSRCTPLWKGVQGLHAFPRTLHAMCMPTIGVHTAGAGFARLSAHGTLGTLIRVPGTLIRVPGTLIRVPSGTLIRVPGTRYPYKGTLIRVPFGTLIRGYPGTLMRVPFGTLIRVPFGTLIRAPRGSRKPLDLRGLREPGRTGVHGQHACPAGPHAEPAVLMPFAGVRTARAAIKPRLFEYQAA
ncbi:hypothetical protein PCANC_00731 [Puccinia coronata f. sp. avenae]|uniref:Uncharacterized protein n=1 Tax=Puccinia coronata f. sp. avenae TaxID=200324 RepID=A0A2N5W718_9BASI|nr:hypothetical protein PCANC_00731 [Puccinia coronata f. sp. avenae]